MNNEDFSCSLHGKEILQLGNFTLASGKKSKIYFDLRLLISYPRLMNFAANKMSGLLDGLRCDLLAPVPLAGIPIATTIQTQTQIPMIMIRPSVKDHGTKKRIEGKFKKGQRVVLIDDLITTAKSKLEAIDILESEGLEVADVIVLIDREQGGREALEERNYNLHSLLVMDDILRDLLSNGRLTLVEHDDIKESL